MIILVGGFGEGLGGSEYLWRILGQKKGPVPTFDLDHELNVQKFVADLIRRGWVRSAHDLSEGGLAVAVAECSIQSGLGAECNFYAGLKLRVDEILFGESSSRVIMTIDDQYKNELLRMSQSAGIELVMIGRVGGSRLRISRDSKVVIDCSVSDMEKKWRTSIGLWMNKIS